MNFLQRFGRPPELPLAPGERILWQGSPAWRNVAGRLLRIRVVAGYFALLTLVDIGIERSAHGAGLAALQGGTPTLVSGGACVLILAALAWAVGRTTRYTLTTRRVIMQYGVAMPATLMLPLHRIAASAVAVRADHAGDIALALHPGEQIPWIKLWPHARPWRFRAPEPMLRDIPRAAVVAVRLTHALASCAEAKRNCERDAARIEESLPLSQWTKPGSATPELQMSGQPSYG
jgi:hypothetical protein